MMSLELTKDWFFKPLNFKVSPGSTCAGILLTKQSGKDAFKPGVLSLCSPFFLVATIRLRNRQYEGTYICTVNKSPAH